MDFEIVVENGNYYFPAWRHYGSSSVEVRCNKCFKHNLASCIGLENTDLCMTCVEVIANKLLKEQDLPPVLKPSYLNPSFLNVSFKK